MTWPLMAFEQRRPVFFKLIKDTVELGGGGRGGGAVKGVLSLFTLFI